MTIINCLQDQAIPVYGDGKQIRDWLYVADHCEAVYKVLVNGNTGETYNIGGGNQPTNFEVVRHICILMDARLPQSPNLPHQNLITFVTDRPGHDRRYAMEFTRITSELGWQPTKTLMTGLEKTVDWYLENLEWVEAILGQ